MVVSHWKPHRYCCNHLHSKSGAQGSAFTIILLLFTFEVTDVTSAQVKMKTLYLK
jgi:hypothetical protein